jgi:hypothetical protein
MTSNVHDNWRALFFTLTKRCERLGSLQQHRQSTESIYPRILPATARKINAFLLKKRNISLMKNVPKLCRNVSYRSAAADMSHSSLFTGCFELKMRHLFVYTAYVTGLHTPPPPHCMKISPVETCLLWGRLFSYRQQLLLTIHRLWQSYINTTQSKNRIVTVFTASSVQREFGWFISFYFPWKLRYA